MKNNNLSVDNMAYEVDQKSASDITKTTGAGTDGNEAKSGDNNEGGR